jgi:hypothetical protein
VTDRMPTIGLYRGVPLHDYQPLDRIDDVVKPAIDVVHGMNNAEDLYEYAADYEHPPEARLFAAAKVRAIFETRASAHESRGDVDLDRMAAAVSGLNNVVHTEPSYYLAWGTPQALAPGVRNSLERRPPHQVERLLEARERAQEWRRGHRPPAAAD